MHDGTIRRYKSKSLDVIAGQSESPGEPSGSSAQDESGSPGMRDDAGRKDQACFLRCGIDRSQQTAAGDLSPAALGIDTDVAHGRQVNDQAAIAGAETCKTMPSTTDCGQNAR